MSIINNYHFLPGWPRLPEDFLLGNPTGLGINSQQQIIVFHRAGRVWPRDGIMPADKIAAKTILTIDSRSGKLVHSWGNGLFILPHGLTVDRYDNIWVTDLGLQQVFKFSHDGILLLQLGEAFVPGADKKHFNFPTDIAVAKDGSFYVSDGYNNSRVVKFSADGKYLFEWGSKGSQAAAFDLPHAIELDAAENIYVADRENNRVQVFTAAGIFVREWSDKCFGKMSSIVCNKEAGDFFAVDFCCDDPAGETYQSGIIHFNAHANLHSAAFVKSDTVFNGWFHNIAIDRQQNIYITDIFNNRIFKLAQTTTG